MSLTDQIRTKPKLWASAGLITAGLTAGAIIGTTASATAATGSTTSSSSTNSSSSGGSTPGPPSGTYRGLPDSGTVTAVGTDSVTIDGTVYAVTSNSDIDKNGEAVLSDLKVGDKVTFSTVSSASTPTIDKLHAGSEALDRPSGPPPGSSGTAPSGSAPSGTPPSGGPPSGSGSSSSGSSSSTTSAAA